MAQNETITKQTTTGGDYDTYISIPEEYRTKCEIWTRVMGYHRPTTSYNIGKKREYDERVTFKEPKSL